jgi:hypothetical protein
VEDYLATVGYRNSVRWSPTREEKQKVETGGTEMPQGLDVQPRLVANFSSRPRKLRSGRREKIDEGSEICFVVKVRRESVAVALQTP